MIAASYTFTFAKYFNGKLY